MAGWNQGQWNTPPWSPFAPSQTPANSPQGQQPIGTGDNFISLYNRLLARCPAIGDLLAQQFINDSWRTFQSMREWSFRRRFSTFAPPNLVNTGTVSTNVANGDPTLLSGTGTAWTASMIGRQIRVGGLLYPFYTIIGYISPTQLRIDQPWFGPDVVGQTYNMLQIYYSVPQDFGWFYAVVSIKDGYKLWTNLTQADLALMDPQRTNFSQTYAVAFRDYTPIYGGIVGPAIAVNLTAPTDAIPVSSTASGFTYPIDATYIIQIQSTGVSGTATFKWMRAGQSSFTGPIATSVTAIPLADGVQIYFPNTGTYTANDLFIVNCKAMAAQSTPRYELWPAPTFAGYLYPYIYVAKEYDLTVQTPWLPPFVSNRGEVLLEMGLEKCAEFPGQDQDHINIYHDLRQAKYHHDKYTDMLIDLMRNDEEVGVSNIDYSMYPFAPAPWLDSGWQQTHAPFLLG